MAKRTRGGGRSAGQRSASRAARQAPPATPAPASRSGGGLTAAEEARAAEIEAQIIAEERAAEALQRRSRERGRFGDAPRGFGRPGAFHERAAEEYTYVRRDLVDIARVGGLLLAILAVLYVLIHGVGVLR